MMIARSVRGLVDPGMIAEMERELDGVIEDFDRAMNVEVLRSTKKTREHLFLAVVHSHTAFVEEAVLLGRLRPVETNYHLDSRCMDGTREFLLQEITGWATRQSSQNESNVYWISGSPGIGKTSLSHSICDRLEKKHLAGAFFCRRDNESLSEPRYILPTLIHKLAIRFPPFRHVVAKRLENNPNLTPGSMHYSLLLELIRELARNPNHTLVFVIDAVDECGDTFNRPKILRALTDAAAHARWLKIIITSRPENDIIDFFDALVRPSHERCDLAEDKEALSDLRTFAKEQFRLAASLQCLPPTWPEQPLFDRVISRAKGLFIFIRTIALAIGKSPNPDEQLKATLNDSDGTGLTVLHALYLSILKAQIDHSTAEFRQMIGALLAAARHRPLCEGTIAELAGLRLNLVKMWVVKLSSLLYRDEGANGGIRVRHLSISEFFLSDACHSDYRVEFQGVNVELGISCLETMIEQLRFNICKLENSRIANADVHDLPLRIKENISDALQYSSLYWSNHLCFYADNGNQRVQEGLRKFFEGPYGLFWIEALSVMGMVPIGVPSLRKVISTMAKVSTTSKTSVFKGESNVM